MAAGEKRKNIRLSEENVNFRMMNLIRKVHGMIDDPDIEKHRHSQNQVGAFLGNQTDAPTGFWECLCLSLIHI